MLGAIAGDIIGSIYEAFDIKTKDFPLFSPKCCYTDDTVMTIAVAEALLKGGLPNDYIEAMKKYGRMYERVGFGGRFEDWIFSDNRQPYNSWGNGSAMRVSPVGWFFDNLKDTEKMAEVSAAVTHNHPEGIKGAQAAAVSIFLVRNGSSKEELKRYIENRYGYDLSRSLDEIRPTYEFDESCMGTVPEAIIAYLESNDFEDAVRNAVSLGGDADTLAAITGSIAEAAYGVPKSIEDRVVSMLNEPLLKVLSRWQDVLSKRVQ